MPTVSVYDWPSSALTQSRTDYCNTVLAGAPRTVTDKLQRVLNAAARVITGTLKFDRGLGQILHDQLHWLDVPDRVLFIKAPAIVNNNCYDGEAAHRDITRFFARIIHFYRKGKCADTIGTVLVPWAGHFHAEI